MGLEGPIGKSVADGAEPGDSMRGVSASTPAMNSAADDATAFAAGTKFDLPVDPENKATKIKLLSMAQPHMRAFHIMWMSFFTSFVSTFAAAPLGAYVRDDLGMTKSTLANAGIASVSGTIAARVFMGYVCDAFGPRYGHAFLQLGTAPFIFCMALARGPLWFIMSRFLIGFSLATFVATQYWSTQMFTPKLVGLANATTGGWGNLGGGVTNLVMPLFFAGFAGQGYGNFTAWRLCFFIPGYMHVVVGAAVLFLTKDLPEGTYSDLRRSGKLPEPDNGVMKYGCLNYRTWCLAISYGFCFGVELTINNIAALYFKDHFGVSVKTAGLLAAVFGGTNLFARSWGGWASDWIGKPYGMRGRLWALWILQTAEGALCVVMGLVEKSLTATIVAMILFSLCVQASEGASYGIVPFVSKRALGVVSGIVGAGGNAGAVINTWSWFKNDDIETYEGLMYMGFLIIGVTAVTVCPVQFPQWGGMFTKADPEATEEGYYLSDYSEQELAEGKQKASLVFAANSRSQRGTKAENHIPEDGAGRP